MYLVYRHFYCDYHLSVTVYRQKNMMIDLLISLSHFSSRVNKGKGKVLSKDQQEENEGLAKLIPDIQETSRLVQLATDLLKQDREATVNSDAGSEHVVSPGLEENQDDLYCTVMREMQFGRWSEIESTAYI